MLTITFTGPRADVEKEAREMYHRQATLDHNTPNIPEATQVVSGSDVYTITMVFTNVA